ncbi:hypothetical protein JHK87_033753 [Glycine soja]|nr:hypothetical protein JHK87_033753 [Glycine soja]
MVVLRASCSGGSRGCGGCEGTTLATVVVAQGSGLVMIAREHTGGSVIAQGSDICGSTGSGEGWLQNEEKEETKGIKNESREENGKGSKRNEKMKRGAISTPLLCKNTPSLFFFSKNTQVNTLPFLTLHDKGFSITAFDNSTRTGSEETRRWHTAPTTLPGLVVAAMGRRTSQLTKATEFCEGSDSSRAIPIACVEVMLLRSQLQNGESSTEVSSHLFTIFFLKYPRN